MFNSKKTGGGKRKDGCAIARNLRSVFWTSDQLLDATVAKIPKPLNSSIVTEILGKMKQLSVHRYKAPNKATDFFVCSHETRFIEGIK